LATGKSIKINRENSGNSQISLTSALSRLPYRSRVGYIGFYNYLD
jgi:hypothetical protein